MSDIMIVTGHNTKLIKSRLNHVMKSESMHHESQHVTAF